LSCHNVHILLGMHCLVTFCIILFQASFTCWLLLPVLTDFSFIVLGVFPPIFSLSFSKSYHSVFLFLSCLKYHLHCFLNYIMSFAHLQAILVHTFPSNVLFLIFLQGFSFQFCLASYNHMFLCWFYELIKLVCLVSSKCQWFVFAETDSNLSLLSRYSFDI